MIRFRFHFAAAVIPALGLWHAAAGEADASARLRAAMAHAVSLPHYAVDADIAMVTRVQDREQRQEMRVEMLSRGTDDLFLRVVSGADEAEVYRNADARAIHFVKRKSYVLDDPPPSRAQTIGTIGGSVIQLGARWLGGFLHNDAAILDTAAETGIAAEVDATTSPVLLRYPDKEVRAWISASDPPVLERLRVNVSTGNAGANVGLSLYAEFTFGPWRTDEPADDARFAFAPPPDVRRGDPMPGRARQDGLVGQPAPKVALPLLEGGTMDLARLQEENKVVVLDFWATWCGPCHVGLPIVSEVAEAFADRGVVFYAVNRRESPDRIRGFLKSKGHNYAVALDNEDEAARAYEVNSIPRTVIIDQEGVVRAVHSGVGPRLRQEIADELERLTAKGG